VSGCSRRMPFFFLFLFLSLTHLSHVFATDSTEAGFRCACRTDLGETGRLAKPTVGSIGSLSALVIFAKFKGEATGADQAPSWAGDLFDRRRPGSFTHFYDEMSGGLLRVDGQALPRRYSADQVASAYLADLPGTLGRFGQFNLEILDQADRDIDMGLFDNDGPDGLPNSGDDDGYVDIVFVNLLTVPKDFLVGTATGLASLGLDTDFISDDPAADGGFVRIRSRFTGFGGTTQRGHVFSVTAATMSHEFGHIMGLVDLFDQSSVAANGELDPVEDSAGIGKWGLMGLGTLGWGIEDGPNAFSAWSLARLGWVEVVEIGENVRDLVVEDIVRGKKIFKIPLTREEYFLLENRQAGGSYYNRNVPASGLLIWHVDERADNDEERHKRVDLVCADGLFADRGFPGEQPDPVAGLDNLDFWARDSGYATAHNGNQGDDTDPFDGVRFTRFAHDANPRPSAHTGFSRNLPVGIAVENIRADGERMVVDVLLRQPLPGHVTADTTWSGTVDAIGDVVVEPGVRLTIAAGTQVRFASFDWYKSGFAPGFCELLVFGELVLEGTPDEPVLFTGSQRRSRWAGLFLLDGQDPDLANTQAANSVYGLVQWRLPPGLTRWSGRRKIPLDLVVPADAELRIDPGTVVEFGLDVSSRGIFPELTELIVDGRLTVEGESSRPARFTSDPLVAEGIWYGVRLGAGALIDVRYLQVERAGFAFSGEVAVCDRLRIADSWIVDGAGSGLRLTVNGRVDVKRTLFAGHPGQGIRVEGSGLLALNEVEVLENGLEGIFLGNASMVALGSVVERNGWIDPEDPRSGVKGVGGRGQVIGFGEGRLANSDLHGLDLEEWEGRLVLRDVEIDDNRGDGLRGRNLERATLEGVSVEKNVGTGATLAAGPVEIRNSVFAANVGTGLVLEEVSGRVEESVFSGGPGLEIEASEALLVRNSRFEETSPGLVSLNSAPRVEGNRFFANETAIRVRGSRVPIAIWRNAFIANGVALENATGQTLQAQENYWGTTDSTEIAALISGPAAWVPFLESAEEATAVTAVEGVVPTRFALYPPFPNPFNSQVDIPFEIAAPSAVELAIYDALGRRVRLLVEATLASGVYRVNWDGRDGGGREAASGVYFLRLQAGEQAATGRIALVR
jgi:M6 family metalloprotease-like protein